MSKTLTAALALGAPFLLCVPGAMAQEASRFTWEGELEIGNDSVVDSNTPGNEISDTYATGADALAKQTEVAQEGFNKALANYRELAEMEVKTYSDAWKVVQDRMQENMTNLQKMLQPK